MWSMWVYVVVRVRSKTKPREDSAMKDEKCESGTSSLPK